MADLCVTVVLSSVVIGLALALAFHTSSRQAVFGLFRFTFASVAHGVKRKKVNPTTMRTGASLKDWLDFMVRKQKEWERRDNASVHEQEDGLPMHQVQDGTNGGSRKPSWAVVTWANGQQSFNAGMARVWSRRRTQ